MKIPRLSATAGALLALLGAALPANATVYWTNQALLADFFKGVPVTYRTITLSDATAAEIGKKLGVDLPKKEWSIYLDESAGHARTAYAVLDRQTGLHEMIDYGVRFSLTGAVERVEIREYREAYGDEVRRERFRNQFVGKTASDPITAGQDIAIISGASYSSKAMALGIKRDTLILQAALKNGLLVP